MCTTVYRCQRRGTPGLKIVSGYAEVWLSQVSHHTPTLETELGGYSLLCIFGFY